MRLIDADKLDYELKIALKNYEHPVAMVASMTVANAPTVDLWHYPSKGELPKPGADVWDGFSILNYLPDLKRWVVESEIKVDEPRCWCYLPYPPKEEA